MGKEINTNNYQKVISLNPVEVGTLLGMLDFVREQGFSSLITTQIKNKIENAEYREKI